MPHRRMIRHHHPHLLFLFLPSLLLTLATDQFGSFLAVASFAAVLAGPLQASSYLHHRHRCPESGQRGESLPPVALLLVPLG